MRADGAGLRIEPVTTDNIIEENGRLVIPAGGTIIDDDLVRALRLADQK